MIININLYSEASVVRIAQKTIHYLKKSENIKYIEKSLWINGMYLKFENKSITVNILEVNKLRQAIKLINYILKNEEAYISNNSNKGEYYNNIINDINLDYLIEVGARP